MFSCQALVVLAAVAAGGDTTVLQFSSQSCPACRAVEPVVKRLQSEGYAVQLVDVEQRPELAQQFQVRAVPTFVAVEANRETDRVIGAASYDRLVQMFRGPAASAPASAPTAPQQTLQPTDFHQLAPVPQGQPAAANQSAASPKQRALHASVRLKVEDSTGFGYGTGTIIDRHDDEALVVTCGHLFRQSQGKGTISADLFAPGATSPVPGQLIAYDLDRDIALVSIRPGIAIEPVRVPGPSYVAKPHDTAFSVGCDKGAEPSIRDTRITAVNKYQGAPNITASGQPVDGRSGGGLFSEDGLLIGICNAADPADDEGLYAALASIHWQLDQIGQSDIYQQNDAAGLAATSGNTVPGNALPAGSQLAQNEPGVPNLPARMPQSGNVAPASHMAAVTSSAAGEMEVIMILRSKKNPQGQSEIFVLDHASPELVQQIAAKGRPAALAQANAGQAATAAWDTARTAFRSGTADAPIVRGQSAD